MDNLKDNPVAKGVRKAFKANELPDPMEKAVSNRNQKRSLEAGDLTNQEFGHLEDLRSKAKDESEKIKADWAAQGLDEYGSPIRKPKPTASTTPESQ